VPAAQPPTLRPTHASSYVTDFPFGNLQRDSLTLSVGAEAKVSVICSHRLPVNKSKYALELGLQAVPLAEGRVFPQLYFFDVVQKTNIIVHLLDKLCHTSVIPCVRYVRTLVIYI